MDARKTRCLPARLASLQRRFEDWRRTRQIPARIPDSLWSAAARAASTHGVSRVATVLRVNYHALKERVERTATGTSDRPSALSASAGDAVAKFVELTSPVSASPCECILELQDTAGAKMRIQWKGVGMPDLAALSRSFWNPAP
jgi:hypothetical protein